MRQLFSTCFKEASHLTWLSVPKSGALVLSRAVPATPHVTTRLTGSLSCNLRHPQCEPLRPILTNWQPVGRTQESRLPEFPSSGIPH